MKNTPYSSQGSAQDGSVTDLNHARDEQKKIFELLKKPFKSDCERCSGSGFLATKLICSTCKGKGKIFIDLL